jgi:hypothetical protein
LGTFEAIVMTIVKSTSPESGRSPRGEIAFDFRSPEKPPSAARVAKPQLTLTCEKNHTMSGVAKPAFDCAVMVSWRVRSETTINRR